MLLLPLLLACTATPPEEAEADPLLPLGPVDLGVETTEGDPAAAVAWESVEGAENYVEFGYDKAYGRVAPATPGVDARARLLGLKGGATVHARVLRVVDGEVFAGDDTTFVTPPTPSALRPFDVARLADPELADAFALVTTFDLGTGASDVMVVDADGDPVWWSQIGGRSAPAAHMLSDGSGVAWRVDDLWNLAEGAVRVSRFDGSAGLELPDLLGHHDLVPLPDGKLAVLGAEVRGWEEWPEVVGDQIVELDPKGEARVVWSAWDSLTPKPDPSWKNSGNPLGADWTHANGLAYAPGTDEYAVSLYGPCQVLGIDRSSGEVRWSLGRDAELRFTNDRGFCPQHAPAFDEGGVWVFDNDRGQDDEVAVSRVVHYQLDLQARTATLDFSWEDPDGTWTTGILGDVFPLPDGSVATTWGATGRMLVLSPEGEPRWEMTAPKGTALGRGAVFSTFYPGVTRPY